jgi:hypothetical protein
MAYRTAASLKPGPQLMFSCCLGDILAEIIRDSWKFRFPIIKMSAASFAKLADSSWGIAW